MNPYAKTKTQYDLVEETNHLTRQINDRMTQLQHRNRDKVEGREDRAWLRCRRSQDETERIRHDYHVIAAIQRDEPIYAGDEDCACRCETPHKKLKIGGIKDELCPIVLCLKIQKYCLRTGRTMDVSLFDKLMSLARTTTSATRDRPWTRCGAGS